MILLNVEDMDIVHPMRAVVAAKVVDLRVHEAACRGNTRGGLLARDGRLDPGQRTRVQIKDIIQLSVLIWLSAEDVNLFLESNR